MTDDELKAIRHQAQHFDAWDNETWKRRVLALLAEVERLQLADKVARVQTRAHEETIGSLRATVSELEGYLRAEKRRNGPWPEAESGSNLAVEKNHLRARVAELEGAVRTMADDLDDHAFEARRQAKDADPVGHWGVLDNLLSYLIGGLSEQMREATNEGFRPSGVDSGDE